MEVKIRDVAIEINDIIYDKEHGNYIELKGRMKKGEETNKLIYYTLNSYLNDDPIKISIGTSVSSKKVSGDFQEDGDDLVYTIHIFT